MAPGPTVKKPPSNPISKKQGTASSEATASETAWASARMSETSASASAAAPVSAPTFSMSARASSKLSAMVVNTGTPSSRRRSFHSPPKKAVSMRSGWSATTRSSLGSTPNSPAPPMLSIA